MDLHVTSKIVIPEEQLHLSFSRSGGPGGQNVNKVSSKATLRWDVTTSPSLPDDVRQRFLTQFPTRVTKSGEVVIQADEFRDQPKNIQACYDRLHEMLTAVLKAPKKRHSTKPTRGSKVRRLKEKKSRAAVKEGRRFRGE